MRPRAHQAERQLRLTAYGHIIQRYLRYVLIRCTGYTNDKSQVQRIAVYALVTACLLFDKINSLRELGWLVEMMVRIAAEDPVPDAGDGETVDDSGDGAPVFGLDEQMCEVAGAINALEQFDRELLILHHVEGIEPAVLADAHGVSTGDIRAALAAAEAQFLDLLQGMSSWDEQAEPNVHGLLTALADCIDRRWAESLGEFALRYIAAWDENSL